MTDRKARGLGVGGEVLCIVAVTEPHVQNRKTARACPGEGRGDR